MQNEISIGLRGWSGRTPSLPLSGFFVFLSFFGFLVTRTGRTSGPIVTIYASYDVILGKDVPFGGYVDMVHYLGGQIPQKPQFWGLNRHFQAKRAKYENLHIIKTTAPISSFQPNFAHW